IYGFASGGPPWFKRVIGHRNLFYIDDKDVDLKDVIEAPLPKAPLDTTVLCHWLAIEGVQPAIPENASVEVIAAPSDGKKVEQKDDALPVEIKLPVKHVLSRELQLYFNKITELTMSRSDFALFKQALVSLATDSGLHPLVPYFTYFIADEVSRGLNDYSLLFALMRIVQSLLQNPHIHIEPYLHQLMPSVVTCLVAKRLGNRFADNHWELRDFSANLVASICKRFGHVYSNLQTRLTNFAQCVFGPKTSIDTTVRILILPNLELYMRLLEPEMLLEKQKNEMKREGKAVVPAPLGESNVGPSSSSGQTMEIIVDGRGGRGMGDNKASNVSAVLSQIWKNDLDSGRLLVLLFELFGEGILPFIPAPEMSLFL
ncbi:Transcription initiation factor TFIID subunit 6, partial [Morella rubra]